VRPRAAVDQARALAALDRIDSNGSLPLFRGERGGYLDIHHFRPNQWRPAQKAAGVSPLRRVYDLRHTFATFALVPASQPSISLVSWVRA
jgi:integrase